MGSITIRRIDEGTKKRLCLSTSVRKFEDVFAGRQRSSSSQPKGAVRPVELGEQLLEVSAGGTPLDRDRAPPGAPPPPPAPRGGMGSRNDVRRREPLEGLYARPWLTASMDPSPVTVPARQV